MSDLIFRVDQNHHTTTSNPASNKECVLIFDTRTGEFTLERLQSNFILKRSRLEGSSKAAIITPRSVTPTNEAKKKKPENKNNPTPSKTKENIVKAKSNSPVSSNVSQMKAGIFNKIIPKKLSNLFDFFGWI
ncbi:ELL-associated factor 1-like [Brachionus plicatilis]|uniref:ELL-associated factor 1-like n=1 Tax=Brachionus plicatilis TaxID=10195 RepID=A0A3M7PQ13_BRAPC|nr:ELL-associated factor 1-like [Brachionus plicatilis]